MHANDHLFDLPWISELARDSYDVFGLIHLYTADGHVKVFRGNCTKYGTKI